MARRSAEREPGSELRMVKPSGPAAKRNGFVPVADLLAREGRPMAVDDTFLVADAVASVRRGMVGICVGLLAVVGAGTILDNSLNGEQGEVAGPVSGGSTAEGGTQRPTVDASTPKSEPIEVIRAAQPSSRRAASTRMTQQRRHASSPAAGSSGSSGSSGGSAPDPAPQQSAPDWQELSGNYGQDYSGNYGQDYWDWNG